MEEVEFKSSGTKPREEVEAPPAKEPKKPTRKQKLIAEIIDLYPDMGSDELSKMTMAKLNQLKQNYKIRKDTQKLFPDVPVSKMPESEEECRALMGQTIDEKLADIAQDRPVQLSDKAELPAKASKLSPELEFELRASRKAKTLFNFHLVSGGVLETLSEAEPIESRLGSNLAGLTKDLLDEKEEFLEILKDLYCDYAEDIDPYINSLTVYGLFMSNKIQNRFMENKKKSSSGKLPKSQLKLEDLLGLQQPRSVSSSLPVLSQPGSSVESERQDNII